MNIQQLLKKGYDILKEYDIESYMLDSQLILAKVLDRDRLFLITNREIEVDTSKSTEYLRLIELRSNRMPVKYILEECEFMGINFFVREGVLIPRSDTEILTENVIELIKQHRFNFVCDVCTGSGAIGLSIAKFVDWVKVVCFDISEDSEKVTKENIKRLLLEDRVQFKKSDLLEEAVANNIEFDVIVSNPPYIRTDIIPTLMEDVKNYEPYIALWGGDDGLEFYRKITSQSLLALKGGGLLAFEIGYDQGREVMNILKDYAFDKISCLKDLAGKDRVVLGFKKA